MKIAYIAHPIGGDVEGNLQRIQAIVRQINLEEPDVVPFVPYYADCVAMNDGNPAERERGIKNDTALLKRGFVDEMRLYGERISAGMACEVDLAHKLYIPVVPMTEATRIQYAQQWPFRQNITERGMVAKAVRIMEDRFPTPHEAVMFLRCHFPTDLSLIDLGGSAASRAHSIARRFEVNGGVAPLLAKLKAVFQP